MDKMPNPGNTEKSPRTDREIIKKRLQNHQEMTENVWEILFMTYTTYSHLPITVGNAIF